MQYSFDPFVLDCAMSAARFIGSGGVEAQETQFPQLMHANLFLNYEFTVAGERRFLNFE